jgi:hypothetical protein
MSGEEVHVDCAQFREIVHDLDRAETRGFVLRESAFDHAESCSECGALLNGVEFLDSALSQMAAQDAGKQAPARVEAALLEAFRRQSVTEITPKKTVRLPALGMAAALALMVGMGLHYWRAEKTDRLRGGATATEGAPAAVQGTENAGTNAAGEVTVSADEEDGAYATNFVSLPYADDPATLEDATIVRVMLSRSALASFGMPVADMDASDQIPADIALSEDGSPQAIRLVAESDLDN